MKTQHDLSQALRAGQDRLLAQESAGVAERLPPMSSQRQGAWAAAGNRAASSGSGVVHVAHRFPLHSARDRDPSAYLVSPASLLTYQTDTFRRLFAHLSERLPARGMLLMASARHAEGRSIAALSLSIAFAQKFARVVYVEADFRRPALRAFFDIPACMGMSDLLWDDQPGGDLASYCLPTDIAGLYLLAAGTKLGLPERVEPPRIAAVLARLRAEMDWAIIDCPPLLSYPDALPLIGLVDGVIVVAREGRTRDEDFTDLTAYLATMPTPIVGTVFIGR